MHYILDFTWESSGKSGWFALFVLEAFEAQYLSVFKADYFVCSCPCINKFIS